jgi:hypothetical protein
MSEPERAIKGSCLCQGIAFEIRGKPLWMSHCHCDLPQFPGSPPGVGGSSQK